MPRLSRGVVSWLKFWGIALVAGEAITWTTYGCMELSRNPAANVLTAAAWAVGLVTGTGAATGLLTALWVWLES